MTITAQDQFYIDDTLKRARELAKKTPAWDGGFANLVLSAIEVLQDEIVNLETQRDHWRKQAESNRLRQNGSQSKESGQ